MQNNTNQNNSLYKESRNFQSIRILNVFYFDNLYPRNIKEKELSGQLINRLNNNEEFKHLIDFIFKIEEAWNFGNVEFQRTNKNSNKDWQIMDFSNKAFSHPLYIVGSSTFNEDLDKSLRKALQVKIEHEIARLEPISYYAFGKFNKNSSVRNSDIINCKFGLLFFQIADPSLSEEIDNTDTFFNDKIFRTSRITEDFGVVAYGLLKGDMEGFILFALYDGILGIFKLQEHLKTVKFGILSKIMPIVLYGCDNERNYNHGFDFDNY
jgi:hypothetical protein